VAARRVDTQRGYETAECERGPGDGVHKDHREQDGCRDRGAYVEVIVRGVRVAGKRVMSEPLAEGAKTLETQVGTHSVLLYVWSPRKSGV